MCEETYEGIEKVRNLILRARICLEEALEIQQNPEILNCVKDLTVELHEIEKVYYGI